MKIGIIGKGNVGTAIAAGLTRAGTKVKHGPRDPKEPVAEVAKWGEVIFLAVPYENVQEAVETIGSAADGKILVVVTNMIGEGMPLAVGFSTSGAEELPKLVPKARVVKAFNTVFCPESEHWTFGQGAIDIVRGGR